MSNEMKANERCFTLVSAIAECWHIKFRHVRFVSFGENWQQLVNPVQIAESTARCHRESSPIAQTAPEPTLLTWGVWPQPLATLLNSVLSHLSGHSDPIVLEPFDVTICHEHKICLRFYWALQVIIEMAFSAHCTQIWKLNRISMTIIGRVTRKCIWCYRRVQLCVTAPHTGGKLCSGLLKRGQGSQPRRHVLLWVLLR